MHLTLSSLSARLRSGSCLPAPNHLTMGKENCTIRSSLQLPFFWKTKKRGFIARTSENLTSMSHHCWILAVLKWVGADHLRTLVNSWREMLPGVTSSSLTPSLFVVTHFLISKIRVREAHYQGTTKWGRSLRDSRRFPCPWDSDTSGLGWGLCTCRFGNPTGDGGLLQGRRPQFKKGSLKEYWPQREGEVQSSELGRMPSSDGSCPCSCSFLF